MLGGEDPKERSNVGLKIKFFNFFLKFGLACRKIEASQGFWYQGVGTGQYSLSKLTTPDLHKRDVPIIAHFP